MSKLRDYKPLRLVAEDESDLGVISACLQDAIGKVGDFVYLAEQRRFAFVVNRFVWECASDGAGRMFARVRSGVHFDDVSSVKRMNLRYDVKDAVVELLAATFEPGEEGAGAVILEFAGGGAIRLEVECVNAHLSDISEPWRTRSKPSHGD